MTQAATPGRSRPAPAVARSASAPPPAPIATATTRSAAPIAVQTPISAPAVFAPVTDPDAVAVAAQSASPPTPAALGAAAASREGGAPEGPNSAEVQRLRDLAASAPLGQLPPATEIPGVVHVWQKWNNCGPSAILMALSAHGLVLDQLAVAADIKPDREDTNVPQEELAAFARGQGFGAVARYGGDRNVVRRLVAAGVPVIAEQWIDVEGRGEMGHYRVVIGYDDNAAEFIVQDSYYGARRRYSYDELEAMWRPFLGRYVAVYRPEQAAAVAAALGNDLDDAALLARTVTQHDSWVADAPGNPWAWYTLGEVRSMAGDHDAAVSAFERAIAIGLPTRAFWYQFGFYESLIASGRYESALAQADRTLATMQGENLEESQYWRGVALEHLGRRDDAIASYRAALHFNRYFAPASEALARMAAEE